MHIILVALIALVVSHEEPVVIESAHTFNAFQVTLSLAPQQTLSIYSMRMVDDDPSHWVEINTFGERTLITPPLDSHRILLNEQHNERYVVEYYEVSQSRDMNRHFHYL